jgi:hypothetical protein
VQLVELAWRFILLEAEAWHFGDPQVTEDRAMAENGGCRKFQVLLRAFHLSHCHRWILSVQKPKVTLPESP